MSIKPAAYAQAEDIIRAAIESGINFFDTADLYEKGLNEEMLGNVLAPVRDKVIIATKVGNEWREDGSGWDWNPSREYILKAVEKSLRRLRTDRIDLYQLHGGTIDDPFEETVGAFETLRQQGKIRYYGISSIRPNVIRRYVKHSAIASVMMQYSLLDRRPEEQMLSLLKENGIGVLARGTVAGGLLAGKPAVPYLKQDAVTVGQIAGAVEKFSSAQRSSSQTAIRYVLQHPSVSAAVIGIRTLQQLQDAVGTLNTAPLGDDEIGQLRNTASPLIYTEHR